MGIQLVFFLLAPYGNPTVLFFSHPMGIQHFFLLAPNGNSTFFFSAPHGNPTFLFFSHPMGIHFFCTPWQLNLFFPHPMAIKPFFLAPHGNPTFFGTPWESNFFFSTPWESNSFFQHPMGIQHFFLFAPHENPTFSSFSTPWESNFCSFRTPCFVFFNSFLRTSWESIFIVVFSTPWSNAMAVGPRRRRLGRSAGVGADCQAQVAGASRWDSKPEGNKCDKPMLGFPMCF